MRNLPTPVCNRKSIIALAAHPDYHCTMTVKQDGPTIAIIDDHRIFREELSRFLSASGYRVIIEAFNGQHFLDLLQALDRLPQVCLLDINMPVMNGYETTAILRKQYPAIKILAMTAFEEKGTQQLILRSGADGFLSKTSVPQVWLEKIEEVYNMRR